MPDYDNPYTHLDSSDAPFRVSTGAVKIGSTTLYTVLSSSVFPVIPQSTVGTSTAAAPTDLNSGVAIKFVVSSGSTGSGYLMVYSTVLGGWAGSTFSYFKLNSTALSS
jgi:hypothetical protein